MKHADGAMVPTAPTIDPVRNVISVGAYVKMIWIHAGAIVASMANKKAIRDKANMNLIGKSVRENTCRASLGGIEYSPVPPSVSVPRPFPAIIRLTLRYELPKSSFNWCCSHTAIISACVHAC